MRARVLVPLVVLAALSAAGASSPHGAATCTDTLKQKSQGLHTQYCGRGRRRLAFTARGTASPEGTAPSESTPPPPFVNGKPSASTAVGEPSSSSRARVADFRNPG